MRSASLEYARLPMNHTICLQSINGPRAPPSLLPSVLPGERHYTSFFTFPTSIFLLKNGKPTGFLRHDRRQPTSRTHRHGGENILTHFKNRINLE